MAIPAPKPKAPRYRFPTPWGLFGVLLLYAGAVYFYIDQFYWQSPDYQAVMHFVEALKNIGTNECEKCTEAQAIEGMRHLLEASRLAPQEKGFATRIERLRGRFHERKFKMPEEMRLKAEIVSKYAMQEDQSREAWLVKSRWERGWAPEQLLEGPKNVVFWAIPGGVVIIVIWVFQQFSHRRAWQLAHIEHVKNEEAELEELGAFRRGLDQVKAPAPEEDEDEADDTIADPPPRRSTVERQGVARKPVTSSAGTPAAKKPGASSAALKGVGTTGRSASASLKGVAGRPSTSSGRPAVTRGQPEDAPKRRDSVIAPASVAPPKRRGGDS